MNVCGARGTEHKWFTKSLSSLLRILNILLSHEVFLRLNVSIFLSIFISKQHSPPPLFIIRHSRPKNLKPRNNEQYKNTNPSGESRESNPMRYYSKSITQLNQMKNTKAKANIMKNYKPQRCIFNQVSDLKMLFFLNFNFGFFKL